MLTHENNISLNSQWTKETFGYLEIFDFEIFDLVIFWPFIKWPGLTFSPSKFAFSTKDQMKLDEFILHIKNKKMRFAYKGQF